MTVTQDIGRTLHGPSSRIATVVLAATCFVAVLAGLSLIAGWHEVAAQLKPRLSFWFALAFAAEAASFAGYVLAYSGVAHVGQGRSLSFQRTLTLVAVGFGAFLAKGGAALDKHGLRANHADEREGEARVLALDALEHAALAPAACIAAIALLIEGQRKPGLDFTLPWAILVPVGALVAFYGVRHQRHLRAKPGWCGTLGQILYAINLLFQMARDLRRYWAAFLGASIYWAGDVLCLWSCLQPFSSAPTFEGVVIAHAAGYVLTRRTLPLAGAGVVELLMPLTLAAAGASLTGAILGVIAYRIYNLWLPLIPAFVALRIQSGASASSR